MAAARAALKRPIKTRRSRAGAEDSAYAGRSTMPFSEQQSQVAEEQPDDEVVDPEAVSAEDDAAPALADAEADEQADGAVEATADDGADPDAEVGGEDQAAVAELSVDLRTLEALLLSTHSPLTAGRLGELLDLPTTKPIRKAIKELNRQYEEGNRSFRIEQVAGGYQILTMPEFGEVLKRFHQK